MKYDDVHTRLGDDAGALSEEQGWRRLRLSVLRAQALTLSCCAPAAAML